MSKYIKHTEIPAALQAMDGHIAAAQELLDQADDHCIDSLKLLAEARLLGNLAIVSLMSRCIEQRLGAVQMETGDSTAREFAQLIELADFFLLNLCFPCRVELGRSLRV